MRSTGEDRFSGRLDLDSLVRMTPEVNDQDLVQIAARHPLASHCRCQLPVKEVFFPSISAHQLEDSIDPSWFDFESFAVLLMCQAIGEGCDEYGFHTMINKEILYRKLSAIYQSAEWKRLGLALYCLAFIDIVKDEMTKIPFSAFVNNDRRKWAADLQNVVCSPEWLTQHYRPPAAATAASVNNNSKQTDHNKAINTALIKLHLLDPASVAQTFNVICRIHPNQSLDLATRNYLGGPLDCQLFAADAERAVHRAVYPCPRPPRIPLSDMEVFYGSEVVDFLLSEARSRGVWSGKHPENCRQIHKLSSRCTIM